MKTQEKNETNGTFCERLALAIKQSKVKQKELAKAINLTPQTLSRYKKGKRTPNSEDLHKLAKFFGVTASWLMGEEPVQIKSAWQNRALAAEARLRDAERSLSAISKTIEALREQIRIGNANCRISETRKTNTKHHD